MKKIKELLLNHRSFSYVFLIAFWSRILFSIIANSVDEGAQYSASESFEPSPTEQGMPAAGGSGESDEFSLGD